MACEQYLNWIQEQVDGTIGSIRRAQIEVHVDECDDCRGLVEALKRIDDAAADLPELAARDRAWLQIAGRLRQEGRIREEARAARPAGHGYAAWLAIAAALVIAAGSAVMLLVPRGAQTPPAQTASAPAAGNAATGSSVDAVNAVEAAQAQFEKAIADLETVAKANQHPLHPGTSATIDKNLGILDQAIAENRAAVRSEPASVAAPATLFDALPQKVSLLQATIALTNATRQGNNAAAAQLVNKS